MKMSKRSANQQNISCEQVEDQLVAYVKKSLPVAKRAAIAEHLASCDACAFSLQQFNALERELYAEADQYQPRLSLAASQRIQEQVYRRMSLSMVWQRLFQGIKTGLTFASMAVVFGIVILFAYQWVQFLATPDPVQGNAGLISPEAEVPMAIETETAVFQPELIPDPISSDPPKIEGLPAYWQNLSSITVGESPEKVAEQFVISALNNNQMELNQLLGAMKSIQEPNVRLWMLFNQRCYQTVTAQDFEYVQAARHELPITTVYLLHNDRYTGEIKFRRINGDWFAVFSRPPSINACLKTRFTLPLP